MHQANHHCLKRTYMQFEMLGCWNWQLPSSFVTQQSHLFETIKMMQMMLNLYNGSVKWLIREKPTEFLCLLHLSLMQPDHLSCSCAVRKPKLRNISLWMISEQERGHFGVDLGAKLRGACWSYSPSVSHSLNGEKRDSVSKWRETYVYSLSSHCPPTETFVFYRHFKD